MGYVRKTKPLPPPIKVHAPDWRAMVLEVKRAGYTNVAIEVATGLTRERIDGLINGTHQILWAHGEALNAFVNLVREAGHARQPNP
jgi:hypothetical protein